MCFVTIVMIVRLTSLDVGLIIGNYEEGHKCQTGNTERRNEKIILYF